VRIYELTKKFRSPTYAGILGRHGWRSPPTQPEARLDKRAKQKALCTGAETRILSMSRNLRSVVEEAKMAQSAPAKLLVGRMPCVTVQVSHHD
jgi:hypothetical protein